MTSLPPLERTSIKSGRKSIREINDKTYLYLLFLLVWHVASDRGTYVLDHLYKILQKYLEIIWIHTHTTNNKTFPWNLTLTFTQKLGSINRARSWIYLHIKIFKLPQIIVVNMLYLGSENCCKKFANSLASGII